MLPNSVVGAASVSPVGPPAVHDLQTALTGARGRRDGRRVVSAMNAILEQTKKPAKIIGPIDGATKRV